MRRAAAALVACALLGATLAACGSPAAPTPTPTLSPSPSPAPTAARTLRDVDFTRGPLASELITRAGGGQVNRDRTRYLDLTGDGQEEAVVVVESGGTAGDLAAAVFGWRDSAPSLLFFHQLAGHVEVRLNLVVLQEGVYAAGEPACCPSKLRERAYGWRESKFTLISDQVVPNPAR